MRRDNNIDIIPKGKVRSLSYLNKYLSPYRSKLVLVLLALMFSSSSVLMIGQCLRMIIDQGLSIKSQAGLNQAFLILLGVVSILSAATCARYYLITTIGERVVADIKRDVFAHILHLSADFYESNRSGEIISRMVGDTSLLQNIIGSGISVAMRNIVTLIGGLIMLSMISKHLFALIVLVIPLVVIPIIIFGKQMRSYARLSQEKSADVAAITEEAVMGIKTIQAYTHEKIEYEKFQEKLVDAILAATDRVKARAVLITLVISLTFGAIAWVLWVGSHDVLSGTLTAGELSSFVFIAVLCAGSVTALTDVVGDLQRAGGASERLVEFLNTKPTIVNSSVPLVISPDARGKISFQNITFFYPSRPDRPALDGFNLDVLPGKVTALVGESGAGKSTVFQLLLRFHNVQSGQILFDSNSLHNIGLQSLRSQFAYVAQEPIIFSSTVWDNVVYGKPDATIAEVENALNQAAALEFVQRLPDGLYSYLGEKGVRLSTGQKQRLVIARAFLKDPRILLFDEATSALDSGNEKIVQTASEKLMCHRTTLVIAHRLSTIRNADKIAVMKNGSIVEQGTHEDLMQLRGEYYRLANLQQEDMQ